jgi:hypothetical protein
MKTYNVKNDKNERIDEAMDKIRSKHGAKIITFAALVEKEQGGSVGGVD